MSQEVESQLTAHTPFPKRGLIIIVVAAILSFILYNILPYEPNVKKGLVMLFFVASLWLTEAVHITITALMVPIIGIIIGIGSFSKTGEFTALTMKKALTSFADPTIYLFFGGFALATALHIQKLDRKIAMKIISLSGNHLGIATVAICAVTALLSMWVSNTATAAMMLPLALGMITSLDQEKDRGTFVFILLGIAYSASIGGLGTIVGSPPNAIASAALGFSFIDWMKLGLPMMLLFFPLMLIVLYFVLKPNLGQKIQLEVEEVPWTTSRIVTAVLFVVTALFWIFSKQLSELLGVKLSDAFIAIAAAILIVVLGLATWKDIAKNTEWGVLLLFGGGLTLSAILKDSGASLVLGQEVARIFGDAPKFLIIFVVAIFIIVLTEFTSNTASAALLVPVFAAIAPQVGLPTETLTIVIGIGASCAFMMPVATPPNAIVFGTGLIKQSEMVKSGIILCTACAVVLSIYTYLFYA
ncbi:SLC13 family permease [Campylobacter geochelonis]|uniref:SLC13 family permease n=1 Tax=Campylobacter geochelonis TaxID=1780362 RepID=UPI0007708203|nr:DASS family sodium-coupled anion symporter [Campylobacter geochelonis]CZE50722.1 NadC family protein [Campylobacter geochelonis]